MNGKPSPMTQHDLERELSAMTEPSGSDAGLWREALRAVRRERGTRRIPGRRRVLGAGALAAAVLVLGVSITILVAGELGAPSARTSAMVHSERAAPTAGIETSDLAHELDGMLLAEAAKRDTPEQLGAFAAESLSGDLAGRGGGRDLSGVQLSDQARASRVRRDDTPLADDWSYDERPAPAVPAARRAAPAAETEIVPMAGRPMLEKSADMKLATDEVDEAAARAASLVDPALGEYVVLSRVGGAGLGRRAAVSMRVASQRFESVVDELQELGELAEIESSATDLSAEAADARDRLTLVVETERDILDRYETLPDPLASETYEARRQIRGVRSEIEQLRSRLRSIESRAAWASVRVLFVALPAEAEPAADPGFFDRLGAAAGEGLSALQGVTIWLARALIASAPVIAVLGLISWLVWRRLTRR